MTNPYLETAADLATDEPRNPYAAAAADLAGTQRTSLRSAVYGATQTTAEAARLARQAGLPPDLVQRNLPAVQQRMTVERVDSDTAQAPKLRERYTDPAFAAMARDDSTNLAAVEQSVYTWRQALRKGVGGLKLTLDVAADSLAKAFGADRTETQRILQQTGSYYEVQGSDPVLAAAGERAKAAGGGTWWGTLINLPGEVARSGDGLGTVGRFALEQLPASMAGFGLGAAMTAPMRAAVVSRIAQPLVAKGVNAGLAGAAGNATAVVAQSLGANYQEGLRQGLDEKAANARAWTKTLNEVPANAVAGAALGFRIGPNQLANVIAQTGIQGAGGGIGATMAATSVGEVADPIEIALEILGEGISAVPEVAGMTLSRLSQTRTVQRAADAEAAQANAETLAEVVRTADRAALKRSDPQAFADLVEHIDPERHVYVAPQHLQGVDLTAVPDIAQRAAEAAATGGEVQLTLGELLAHLPGDQLLPHLRVEPEAMTAAEATGMDRAAALVDEMTTPPPDAPLLATPGDAMSADDWQAYMAAADESARTAIEVRDARAMRDLQWLVTNKSTALKKLAAEASAARAEIEPDARAAVEARPVYAAQAMLSTEAGQALPADYVAEMHGFDSADSMLAAIADARPLADAVAEEVDTRMQELRPDMVDTIARERAADAMVADRARTRFLATEAAALTDILGSRAELERNAQAYAQAAVARMTLRRLRPNQHEANAARAAGRAAVAFRRGDTEAAAKAKREQVLQTALQGEATGAAAEVARALEGFKRMLRRDDETRDGNLVQTARAVLAQYGLAATEKTADDYLAQVQTYDPELHADLVTLMEGLPAPSEHRDLTVAEFRDVRDRVEALWTLARSTRTIEVNGQRMEIAEAAASLADRLAAEPAPKRDAVVGTNERLDLRFRLAGVRAALRRVEAWASARDGGNPAGPFTTLVWQPVSEAVTRYRAERNKQVGAFLALLKTIEPTLKPGKIAAPELGDGVVFADRSALLHALLHTGNSSNLRKLLLGYGWAELREDGSMNTSRWDAFLKRMHDSGRITRADWQFVQGVWNLTEGTKPAAQGAHLKMFGHYFAEVTAEPVQTPFGEFSGGYVPAITDSLLVPEARQYRTMDDMLAGQSSPMFPAVNRGFTKARIESYARPLALDLRMLPQHLDKVVRFAELGPVLRDTARLVTRNRMFRDAMNAVDPTAIESMLVPWLKRTAQQTLNRAPESQADRAVARIANTVRNRTGLLLMAGNVVNTLQQVTGFSVAALKVNPSHLAAGLVQLVRNPVATTRAINELSPWMQQRSDTAARDVDQTIERLLTNPNALQRAEEFGMRYGYALQQGFQNVMDRTIWLGAYRQAEKRGARGVYAVREADAAVRQTQGSFAPEDAARVEHATAFTRLFLAFYSYFGAQGNTIATEVLNARGNAGRLALVYLLGFAVPAVVADLIGKGVRGDLSDEDDDPMGHKVLEAFFSSQARYALAMVPVAGQVGNAVLGQFTPALYDDRISASPAIGAVEATARAPFSVSRAMQGEGDARMAVRDGLTAVGLLTGLPTGVLVRPLGYLASDNKPEDPSAAETVQGLITGKAPK